MSADLDEITKHLVLAALRQHIGAANGIKGKDLVIAITGRWTAHIERQLRHVVEALRMEGEHVCAHPESGYFLAATDEELTRCCQFLYDRSITGLQQIAAMKRVSLPDLRGQLHLPT